MAASTFDEDILDGLAPKVTTLFHSLLNQKFEKSQNDAYSGIIFVDRRDAVLALVEILKHHPFTKNIFKVGCLLGQFDTSRRHSLLDITRYISKDDQQETLRVFRVGDLNLLVCTAVAEEGIEIQACGSVITWDPESCQHGELGAEQRRKRSTYTVTFSEPGGDGRDIVQKWEQPEKEMVRLYNDTSRMSMVIGAEVDDDDGTELDNMEIRVESGAGWAALTLHSAIPHLAQ